MADYTPPTEVEIEAGWRRSTNIARPMFQVLADGIEWSDAGASWSPEKGWHNPSEADASIEWIRVFG